MRTTNVKWGMLIAIVALLAIAVSARAQSIPIKWTWTGYFQGRGTSTLDGSPNENTFEVKRMFFFTEASVNDHLSAVLDFSGTSPAKMVEFYAKLVNKDCQARLGLSRLPFGYEVPLSSNKLITMERSQVTTALMPIGQYGFDRGLFGYYQPATGANLSVAVVNGADLDAAADPNNSKNLVARAGLKLSRGEVGASVYRGKLAQKDTSGKYILGTGVTTNRFGLDGNWKLGTTQVIGEWLTGVDDTRHSRGGYLTAAFQKPGSDRQTYLRYDTYDPDTSAKGDRFKRFTAGYAYYFAKLTKWSLEYENINDQLKPKLKGRISTQIQISY